MPFGGVDGGSHRPQLSSSRPPLPTFHHCGVIGYDAFYDPYALEYETASPPSPRPPLLDPPLCIDAISLSLNPAERSMIVAGTLNGAVHLLELCCRVPGESQRRKGAFHSGSFSPPPQVVNRAVLELMPSAYGASSVLCARFCPWSSSAWPRVIASSGSGAIVLMRPADFDDGAALDTAIGAYASPNYGNGGVTTHSRAKGNSSGSCSTALDSLAALDGKDDDGGPCTPRTSSKRRTSGDGSGDWRAESMILSSSTTSKESKDADDDDQEEPVDVMCRRSMNTHSWLTTAAGSTALKDRHALHAAAMSTTVVSEGMPRYSIAASIQQPCAGAAATALQCSTMPPLVGVGYRDGSVSLVDAAVMCESHRSTATEEGGGVTVLHPVAGCGSDGPATFLFGTNRGAIYLWDARDPSSYRNNRSRVQAPPMQQSNSHYLDIFSRTQTIRSIEDWNPSSLQYLTAADDGVVQLLDLRGTTMLSPVTQSGGVATGPDGVGSVVWRSRDAKHSMRCAARLDAHQIAVVLEKDSIRGVKLRDRCVAPPRKLTVHPNIDHDMDHAILWRLDGKSTAAAPSGCQTRASCIAVAAYRTNSVSTSPSDFDATTIARLLSDGSISVVTIKPEDMSSK